MKIYSIFSILAFCVTAVASMSASAATSTLLLDDVLTVTVSQEKAEPGDRVEIVVAGNFSAINALVLKPNEGTQSLQFQRRGYGMHSVLDIPANAPTGLYVLHVWTGDRSKPSAIGKASFRVGNIIADFFEIQFLNTTANSCANVIYFRLIEIQRPG